MSQFLLRDGRTLDLLDNHHKSESAVLFHHGTPGNSTSWSVWVGEFSGGPHALAMSLDKRCVGVITLAGVGKFGQADLSFLEGMGPENNEEFDVALQGGDAPRAFARI